MERIGIIKTDNQLALNTETGIGLMPSENSMLKQALQADKINVANPYEVDKAISGAIDKAIFYLGLKMPESDRHSLKIYATADIRKHFFNLTVSEIWLVIDKGSHGNYGNVVGIAPKDIYNWFKAYCNSQERQYAVSLIQAEIKVPEVSEDDQKAIAWYNLNAAFNSYKEKGYFNDYGNTVYNILDYNSKITFTDEVKDEFLRQARVIIERQFNPANQVGNLAKMSEYREILDAVKSTPKHIRVMSEAKRIALNEFFKGMIETDTSIADLFSE